MKSHHDLIKAALSNIISDMAKSSMLYTKKPGKDFTRCRKLPFDTMMMLLVSMGGNTLTKELMDTLGYDADTVTTSAFVQRRDKILPLAFEYLLHEFTSSCAKIKRYKGYRLLADDGSSLNIAHDPIDTDTHFHQTHRTRGYNLLHLNVLYDLCTNVYIDAIVQPKRKVNEHKAMIDMIARSRINDKVIIVADRGFEGYNNLAHIERKGWYYVIRVKDITSAKGIVNGLQLPPDGEFDVPVSLTLTRTQAKAVKARPDLYRILKTDATFDFCGLRDNLFYPISFRVVRVRLPNGEYETLLTNLDADDFTPNDLREIYRRRWGVETSFRTLKHTIGLVNFHAKKREFILQEIFARLIMYNFVEIITVAVVISHAHRRHVYKVTFSTALLVCRRFLRLRNNEPPLDVEALIRKYITPVRPVRAGQSRGRHVTVKSMVSFTYRIA